MAMDAQIAAKHHVKLRVGAMTPLEAHSAKTVRWTVPPAACSGSAHKATVRRLAMRFLPKCWNAAILKLNV